ncbi:hypothetical protein FF100_04745 [Methylobacterium terricola]|uniref:Uncharacterized protein n=1 Tax=Methylobacterium terricola TaxID=2583531 RepID=A0A5C4LMT4_9HYPH|nr:hypothetical protein [Methylobacterium terricola]TNC14890.1 hypothetical protein FF100_04745 [Methylobacterium terricola]
MKLDEKQLERASREYCDLMGIDPNETISRKHPHADRPPYFGKLLMTKPQWAWAMDDVRSMIAMREAILRAEVKSQPD